MAFLLHVLQGPDRGAKHPLPPNEPQLIGRSSEALPFADTTVSRRHAELTPDEGKWFLRDLESANGTYLNGQRIGGRVELSPGDQIKCGSTLLLFTTVAEDDHTRTIQMVSDDALDVTVEGTIDANEESVLIGAPDPVSAAVDQLRVIYELTALTASAFERDELLERVMDLIFDEFGPDRGFILLQTGTDRPPDKVVVRYRHTPKNLDEGRIPVSRTIVNHTLDRREGVLSTNAMNDKRFSAGDSVQGYGIRSAICVPILYGESIFGVIHIDSSLADFTFTDSQLRLMKAIGQHTGLAIQSVGRFQSRMQTERLAAVGEAVASLSHSIKNILQGLRGGADAVELALNRGDVELAKEGWPILSRNLDRIYRLTFNMLTYSKPPQLEFDLIPIGSMVREVAELLTPHLEMRRIALIQDLDEDMPPIPADGNALHQALMNLLTNAGDAAPAKKGVITIRTRYHAADQEAHISIADNGPGIPHERQDAIFEAFHSTKGQRGTGLGLAVTRKIVEEHGGRLELESEPGEGATFTIVLPSERGAMDPAETKLPRPVPRKGLDDSF